MQGPGGTEYWLHGREDAPLVALIHGLGLTHEVWDETLPALSPHYRLLTYDLHGHGQSPTPAQTPDLHLMARQLADLLDHIKAAKAAIAGFSLGGMIARRFAQDWPARTRALAVLHSPHRRTDRAQAAILARVDQAIAEGPAATVEAALQRWFTEDFALANPDVLNRVRRWVLSNNPATYPHYYRILATGIDEIVAPVPAISCPTLVMTGDQDYGNGPEMTHAIAAEIPGAQVVILPGLRHMAMMEHPASTNAALLAFLAQALPNG
jgi:pimeloyl-ACP methyl ester carboxylesterase